MILPLDPKEWPAAAYDVIYADAPWQYRDKAMQRGGAERSYSTMTLEEISALPVARLATPRAMLFFWCTWPMKPSTAERVMETWGFEYVTCAFDWFKTNRDGTLATGMGHYSRANSEPCFLGRRMKQRGIKRPMLKVLDHSVLMAQLAPRGVHSAKPAQFRASIERLYGPVPRVELFAREEHAGWDSWGDEVAGGVGGEEVHHEGTKDMKDLAG